MASDKKKVIDASAASQLSARLQSFARAELQLATSQLEDATIDPDRAVHECRKAIKRLRALARIGHYIPDAKPQKYERCLRNSGRELSAYRDASEIGKTVLKLTELDPKLLKLRGLERFSVSRPDAGKARKKALRRLDKARAALPATFAQGAGWTLANVTRGVETTYSRAADDMAAFAANHSDKRAHSWRKNVQRLIHQIRMLEDASPEHPAFSTGALRDLAKALGEHNDMAVLRKQLKSQQVKLPQETRVALRDAAKLRQRELRVQALANGQRIFRAPSAEFRRSFEKQSNVIALE